MERVSELLDRLSAAINVLRGHPTMYRCPTLVLAEPIKVPAGVRLWMGGGMLDLTRIPPDEALIQRER